MAQVGIYFVVDGTILLDTVPVERGNSYGDSLNFGGHFDYWSALTASNAVEQRFKDHAHDYFPRGRVVYFKTPNIYRMYADRCLTPDELDRIALVFDLPGYQIAHDHGYQCSGCSQKFIND